MDQEVPGSRPGGGTTKSNTYHKLFIGIIQLGKLRGNIVMF